MTEELRKFLEDNISLVEDEDYETLIRVCVEKFYTASELYKIFKSIGVDMLYHISTIPERMFCGSDLKDIQIPSNITSIGDCAFFECTSLTSVTISSNVTSIGRSAFQHCILLEKIVVPDSVINIGNWAFAFCYNLTSIEIPDGVSSIGHYALSSCKNITICCEAEEKPNSWYIDWNPDNRPVVWGYKGENQ